MSQRAPTIDVLRNIEQENVTAIALVDDNGALLGVLGSAEIRKIVLSATRAVISDRVMRFPTAQTTLLTCDDTTTLAEIMKTFVIEKVGKVFVVDEKGVPLRIITLSDIIKYIC